MSFNAADLFEHAVDALGDRTALLHDDDSRTYAELEERANRVAHVLLDRGIQPGDHVGIYAYNSLAWVEALVGILKARAVPVNVNYRYVEEELRYLFDNADLKGLFFDREFAPRIGAVRDTLPLLEVLVAFDDGTDEDLAGIGAVPFEDALASASPARDFAERSPDDQVIIYTGGTDPFTREKVTDEYQQSKAAAENPGQLVFFNLPPLMHGAAFVATLMNLFQGNISTLTRRFDAAEVWRTIDRHRVNSVLIVGDAMGRPLIEALEELEAGGDEDLDLSCFLSLSSSAAVFSPTVKERFLARFPDLVITDSIGSTEGGFNGIITVGKDNTAMKGGGPTVSPGLDTVVLDDDLRPVEPGSGVIGKVARGGNIPLGYYKDEAKTAATFVIAGDGRRYAVAGDFATVEADGSITLLGRGSQCINTGGEKVFPEEVEQALKAHADVFDAVVVGVPDERWGQRVAAVVAPRPGATVDLPTLDEHCRSHVAGYKVPRELHVVDEIVRSPSGKPDYPWAKELATAGTHRA